MVVGWHKSTFGGPSFRTDTPMPTIRERKYPLPTSFTFTKSRLLKEAERVQALGVDQAEFSYTAHRGMRAMIYASGLSALYTRYSCRKRPYRIPHG